MISVTVRMWICSNATVIAYESLKVSRESLVDARIAQRTPTDGIDRESWLQVLAAYIPVR